MSQQKKEQREQLQEHIQATLSTLSEALNDLFTLITPQAELQAQRLNQKAETLDLGWCRFVELPLYGVGHKAAAKEAGVTPYHASEFAKVRKIIMDDYPVTDDFREIARRLPWREARRLLKGEALGSLSFSP